MVKECVLFLIQRPLYNTLLELFLACQSRCVHNHVAMSRSFIWSVRGFSKPLLHLCYLVEPDHGRDSFHRHFSQMTDEQTGLWVMQVPDLTQPAVWKSDKDILAGERNLKGLNVLLMN